MLFNGIRNIDRTLRSLTAFQQALAAVFCLLVIQYTANFIAYNKLLPIVYGKDPNGVITNYSFLVSGLIAIVFSFYFEGVKGVVRIIKPYSVWKVNILYWLFIIFIMFPLIYIALIVCDLTLMRGVQSHNLIWVGWDYFPTYTPLFAQVAICDELFWIGFVLPRLISGGLTPLKASLMMGVLWGMNYVPYLFTGFFLAPGVNVLNVMLGSFALTPWYVWLYFRTRSALILLVFNIFVQYSQNIVPMLPPDTGGSNIEATFAVVTFFVFGMLIWKLFPLPTKIDEPLKFR